MSNTRRAPITASALALVLAGGGAACTSGDGAAGTGKGGASGSDAGGATGGSGGRGGAGGAGGSGGAGQDGGDAVADRAPDSDVADRVPFDSSGDAPPLVGSALATFNTTDEGFAFSTTDQPANLAVHFTGTAPSLAWTGQEGNPAPGALQVTAPFSAYTQYIDVQKSYGAGAAQDWTGKTRMHVRLRVASGFNPDASFPGSVIVYATSLPTSDAGTGTLPSKSLCTDLMKTPDWQEFLGSFNQTVARWDQSKIVAFGLQIWSGNCAGSAPPAGGPSAAVFYVDSFTLE